MQLATDWRHSREQLEAAMKLQIDVPDAYRDEPADELARRFLLAAALRLFQDGEISGGAACELAGIDRWAFFAECGRRRIPVVDYDPAELAAEVLLLERLRNGELQ
jgi:predicted HTH domain antitoxin